MTRHHWRLALLIAIVAVTPLVAMQQPAPMEVPALLRLPMSLAPDPLYRLGTERLALVKRSQGLSMAITAYNAKCPATPVSNTACATSKGDLTKQTTEYIVDARRFNEEVNAIKIQNLYDSLKSGLGSPQDPPVVRRSVDRVFVGGTGWVYGFVRHNNVVVDRVAEAAFNANAKLSSGTLNVADYDMVIALATSMGTLYDLAYRVVGVPFLNDQSSLGRYTAASQPLYASLIGTIAANLDCHSNGAMVCLNAVASGHILPAQDGTGRSTLDVRLFGPQISPAAIQKWRSLITEGKVRSVEITLNEGDPIAPASYTVGNSPWATVVVNLAKPLTLVRAGGLALTAIDLFSPRAVSELRTRIMSDAPGIVVRVDSVPDCLVQLSPGSLLEDPNRLFACHSMQLYQARSR